MKIKLFVVLWAAISLCSVNNSRAGNGEKACDNDKSAAMVADVAVGRPGCFLATVFGTTIFLVALPFAVASGTVDKTAHALVVCPAKATFTRPLGDFSSLE